MAPAFACMAGMAVYRLQAQGKLLGKDLGPRRTPFGHSESILRIEDCEHPYYLLSRHGAGKYRLSATFVNHRANLYALKDLGVRAVLGWSAVGAISHNLNIGELIVASDLIDRTTRRPNTFFEGTGLGVLRQFPVFCPALQQATVQGLQQLNRTVRPKATLAVTEGPRLETPAEVRMHAATGAEIIGHNFAPEAFLAKELQLCFAGLAYVVNYAETGSRYRPFSAAGLFGGLAAESDADRISRTVDALPDLLPKLSRAVAETEPTCDCGRTMEYEVNKYKLGDDWRRWFDETAGRGVPPM